MKQADKLKLYEMRKKSPGLAVIFSLLVTGAGQMYTGRIGRGLAFLIAQVALWFILMGWVMWIWAPIDAYNITKEYNDTLKLELGL